MFSNCSPLTETEIHCLGSEALVILFVCVVRMFKFYSLSQFQLHNTVLSTLVIMLVSHKSHQILRPYLSCTCKFLPFYQPLPIPPTNSQPLATTFLLCVSMSLTLSFFLKIPHIRNTMQYFSFSFWLISLNIMPSSFIHVVANGRISFFLWLNIPLCVCVCVLHFFFH